MIAGFGECLLRLSPVMQGAWLREASMPVYLGGAELNTLTALAGWGVPVRYLSALPANAVADELIEAIRSRNIDVSGIRRNGDRVGTYYLPQGADLRNSGVIYDRAGSSFSELELNSTDWSEVLRGCDWFHCSAISPGLSAQAAAVCLEAVKAASGMGLTVSIDLNYRSKLWQYGTGPDQVMPGIMRYCQVVMGNPWSVRQLLGLGSTFTDQESGTAPVSPVTTDALQHTSMDAVPAAYESLQQLQATYPSLHTLAYTFRMEDHYWAALFRNGERQISQTFSPLHVVDRVGSGDCFMAALIHGCRLDLPGKELIDLAASAAVGKLAERGDATRQSMQQIRERAHTYQTTR